MKESILQLSQYNLWANSRLADRILTLPPEHIIQNLSSSFASLRLTMLHMWNAESVWWQRVKLQERIIMPSLEFNGNIQEASAGLMQQDLLWKSWVEHASDISLEHTIQYYNTKKENFKQPVWQIVLHVVNHSTYHRGQLINMLRQVGVEKLPHTDFIYWTRKK